MNRILPLLLAIATGCATAARPPPGEPPLVDDGEVYVYLDPLPAESRRVAFTLRSIALQGEMGDAVQLPVRLERVSAEETSLGQRLLARGRVPRGRYAALLVGVASASVAGGAGGGRLDAPEEPVRVPVALDVPRGKGVVVAVSLQPHQSFRAGDAFVPALAAAVPARTPPTLAGVVPNGQTGDLTVLDAWTKGVTGVVTTGASPAGAALDPAAARAWVALPTLDQVEVVDLSRGEAVSRIPLRGGDEPRALQLLSDRRTLLVVNHRSQSAAFVDVFTMQELGRVPLGDGPWSVTLQRSTNRAFVPNRRGATLTVLDVARRQPVATVPTEPEPLFAQVNRDGTRLYLVQAGSPFMTEYALPGMGVNRRIRVGIGASALKVDTRTDLVYVGHEGVAGLDVYDPFSAMPVDRFDLPGPVSRMAIDDAQNQLFALMPEVRAVAVVDLASAKVVAVVDVSGSPFEVRLAAERD